MNMDRRSFIRHLGMGICAGAAVPFIPSLIPDVLGLGKPTGLKSGHAILAETEGRLGFPDLSRILKEYYTNDLTSMIYLPNPALTLMSKNDFRGKNIPTPFVYTGKVK